MKTIQPVNVWVNGEVKVATKLHCVISYDDMATYASFSYTLQQDSPAQEGEPVTPVMLLVIATGMVTMNGQDYLDWDDSNEAAYQYVAEKLNLTIVP